MFTRQDLEQMTVRQLRLIDVREVQDEKLIQEVLNEKLAGQTPNVAINRADAPDIKTPEQEAEYQKIIDARTEHVRQRQSGVTQAPSDEQGSEVDKDTNTIPESAPEVDSINHVVTQEDLDNNPDLVTEGVEVGETIQIPKVEDEGEPKEKDGDKTGSIFCAECNSKRKGKHKKTCSLYVE